jgi:hypothetical protein
MTETSILRSPNGTSIIQIETVFCIVFNTFGRFTGFDKPMLINVYQLLFIKPLGVCEGSEVSSEESDSIHGYMKKLRAELIQQEVILGRTDNGRTSWRDKSANDIKRTTGIFTR